ncbi:Flp pilus assembly complex ATPase component TadA [bacterium]|nr:Flp pilus assembly complex ATPase component TadA [bacterium]
MEKNSINNKTLEKLKYDLVRENLITYEDLEKAEEVATYRKQNIGQVLIDKGVIAENTLLEFLASKLHFPSTTLSTYIIDKKCLKYINASDARKFKMIPLFKIEDSLSVAMSDPLDLFAIDKIVEKIGCEIEPVIVSETSLLQAIDKYYKDDIVGTVSSIDTEVKYDWRDELHKGSLTSEHSLLLIRAILKQAIIEDIHELIFEHGENGLAVKFRTPTEVITTGEIPSMIEAAFVSKLKTASDLDPNVSQISQSGKLLFTTDDNIQLTASVAAFPTLEHERILIKLYKPPQILADYGITDSQKEQIDKILFTPGIIPVCGSSLCGKTHLIYSILQELKKPEKTIMTIESIAKYKLRGIYQSELNENIGFNLDKAMRFIEFQNPDILYFENITTKEGLDYFSSLVFKNKTLLTEFLSDNIEDLKHKLSYPDFATFKSVISCLIYIHGKNDIEIFYGDNLKQIIL